MNHKTLIDGTAYDIKGGKTLIDGTAYDIKGGKTLIDGTAYDIKFAPDPIVLQAKVEFYGSQANAKVSFLDSSTPSSYDFDTTPTRIKFSTTDSNLRFVRGNQSYKEFEVNITPDTTTYFSVGSYPFIYQYNTSNYIRWDSNNYPAYNDKFKPPRETIYYHRLMITGNLSTATSNKNVTCYFTVTAYFD